jgi:predicted transcriptional regulator
LHVRRHWASKEAGHWSPHARISIDRMEIIFATEDLISDGIMSIVEGDEIMKEVREIITTEQLLYRKTKQEVIEAYDRYVRRVEEKNITSERKEILISPGRDILSLISENSSMKLANQ